MDRQAIVRRIRYPVERARRARVGNLLERAVRDYAGDDGSIYAAAITYYLLLSIFPLLLIGVSVLGLLARGDPDFQAQVVEEVTRQLPTGAGVQRQVEEAVAKIARPRSGVFGGIALLGALWTSTGVFGALRKALNNAFDVPSARSFFRGRLQDLASVFAVVVLAITSTALTATLAIVRAYSDRWFDGFVSTIGWGLLFLLLPLIFSFTFFLLLYRLIPNNTVGWADLRIGALVAAVGFELAKTLFTVYLTTFATFNEIYGALGSLIALLVFVFIVANVTIFGAEIASELAKDHAGRETPTV
ncbi:MAG: YihY/virulence factor BrkB family protein [Thermomicrobiales bacterium]